MAKEVEATSIDRAPSDRDKFFTFVEDHTLMGQSGIEVKDLNRWASPNTRIKIFRGQYVIEGDGDSSTVQPAVDRSASGRPWYAIPFQDAINYRKAWEEEQLKTKRSKNKKAKASISLT